MVISSSRPSFLMLRWLALGAAAGVALTLLLAHLGLDGPWQTVAMVLAMLALFAMAGVLVSMRQGERLIDESDQRARKGEAEVGELQRELDRHTQLEFELRQAKQAAESAVMVKGEFLATMSHEIRTPLNGIVPMLDLLMHASLAVDHAELVRTAYTSSQQMLRIVDDILDYSKLEANKLVLESTTFNLRELLESVIQLMDRSAQGKGLRMNLEIEPSVRLSVRGDPVRLRQVVGNLVSNAVKFTERGSVTMSVKRIGETAAQHMLRFEVRDTGIGISSTAQAGLFKAFSQADASTTRLYGGTGLGLAISKRIVDLMDGKIGVDSRPGQGATFWFEVPLLKVHGDIKRTGTASSSRLLLLSTDARLRLRLSMMLPNWGYRVSSVETTQEALDRLRTAASQGEPWTYSIVLADLAGMRSTALALHRNLSRHNVYGELRLVCLYGEGPVPEELQRSATVLSRQAPDEDLRAALSGSTDDDAAGAGAAASAAVNQQAAVPASQPATLQSARVLLVEDNPVNLMVGQRLLGVLGITCDTASNGEAALMRLSASRYDIVLMDCQMPVMDGYTATRRWREGEQAADNGQHLPIIAMTANAMAGDRQKCLDAGMDDYLPKPVTRSELERCLERWWNPERVQDTAAPPPLSGSVPAQPLSDAQGEQALQPPAPAASAIHDLASAERALQTNPFPASDSSSLEVPAGPDPQQQPQSEPEPPVPQVPAATMDAAANLPSVTPGVTTSEPLPPVLDESVLDELRDMLGNDLAHLVEVFLEDTPRIIAALEQAAAVPEFGPLRDAAHSLKSSSANLGAMSLSAAAKRVEYGAREQTLDRPAVAAALIANEFARVRKALQTYVGRSKA
jgi:signal transduction histidine kinase/CheY-like chemotaxis protein